jgi:NDP-sugar pyrophosphorylase family protein
VLLDTGGALKKAAWFFQEDPSRVDHPFLLHNVDVVSTIDLHRMLLSHRQNQALATLAVQARDTSRYLLFDEHGQLCGRKAAAEPPEIVRSSTQMQSLAFAGVHVISPRLLPMLEEQGAFSIIPSYLRLAGQNEKVLAFSADNYYWRDLGTPENVAQATRDLEQGVFRL